MPKTTFEAEARAAGDKEREDTISPRVMVKMPDLFTPVYGLTAKPKVNPFYVKSRKESDDWIQYYCNYEEPYKTKFQEQALSLFAAIMVPEASGDGCRLACDSVQWTTSYDDLHDDSDYFSENLDAAATLRQSVLAVMEVPARPNPVQPVPGITQALETIWARVVKYGSKGTQRRYAAAIKGLCDASYEQVQTQAKRKFLSAEDMVLERLETAGVKPLLAISEICYDLQLPDEVFEHWTLPALIRLACELVAIQNDVISYRKEEQEVDIPRNGISSLRLEGLSAQEAFDKADAMCRKRYKQWHETIAAIPKYDAFVDRQVKLFVDLCLNVVLANASWSFMVERYFKDPEEVLRTRMVEVLAELPSSSKAALAASANGSNGAK